MNQRYGFQGQYTREGKVYSNDRIEFIYSERKESKPGKPKGFLLFKEPCSSKRNYFSGLFPKSETTYKADHKGIEYTVSITSDCLTIKREL